MKIVTEISDDIIRNLLCSAFEGGSNYWYQIDGKVLPSGATMDDYKDGGRRQPVNDNYWHWAEIIPLEEGGALKMSEIGSTKKWVLDRDAIQRGCQTMATRYPQHWGDAISGTGDATTGDVFLQCCLFGELVFG